MKMLSVSEAAGNLAKWLKLAVAGEDIAIRADGNIVALHPLPAAATAEKLSPREALRRLQAEARLTPEQADRYLQEVRTERLATETRTA